LGSTAKLATEGGQTARRPVAGGKTHREADVAGDLGAQLEMFADRVAVSDENATDELAAELDRLRTEIARLKRPE
jgi:hypothetical protein